MASNCQPKRVCCARVQHHVPYDVWYLADQLCASASDDIELSVSTMNPIVYPSLSSKFAWMLEDIPRSNRADVHLRSSRYTRTPCFGASVKDGHVGRKSCEGQQTVAAERVHLMFRPCNVVLLGCLLWKGMAASSGCDFQCTDLHAAPSATLDKQAEHGFLIHLHCFAAVKQKCNCHNSGSPMCLGSDGDLPHMRQVIEEPRAIQAQVPGSLWLHGRPGPARRGAGAGARTCALSCKVRCMLRLALGPCSVHNCCPAIAFRTAAPMWNRSAVLQHQGRWRMPLMAPAPASEQLATVAGKTGQMRSKHTLISSSVAHMHFQALGD